jgi:PadR family transcriptional regulator, regulatory protein AphA
MSLSHAILGFLEYRPMTGYDLKKYIDQSIAHFWSAAQSPIYHTLEVLEKDGYVASEVIPQETRPNRRQYQITPAGRTELRRWLTSPLPVEQVREGWLIQVFFSHFSTNDEIAALLEVRMQAMRDRLAVYRTVAQVAIDQNAKQVGVERARQLWQITLDHGIDYYEFELAWYEKMLNRVRELPPLASPQ